MKKMDKKAFTLIELLVVIAVVGILVLLAAPRFIGYTQRAEDARIQHDVKLMEQEVGTVLINNYDDFNKWEDNSKDFNQLAQDNELFEKEGVVVDPIDGPYKVLPEEYKDKINTKLKGTFYANSDGKVYYEYGEGPGYSDEEIDDLINKGYIPVATADELDSIRSRTLKTYGKGTKWEKEYEGGLGKQYVQVANIDLSEYSVKGWNPIGDDSSIFTGTYDGGNYVITNLYVNGEGKSYQGLFGYTKEATISNVGLIANKVTGTGNGIGGLVGYADRGTMISNSYATGEVSGTGTGRYVGGLVGSAGLSTISDSYATGSVTGTDSAGGQGAFVGGLVGLTSGSTIENSYATGSVEGTGSYVGGLVGYISWREVSRKEGNKTTTISNSYATGSVTATSTAGGLVGGNNSSTIENSYFTGSVTGGSWVGGLVGYDLGTIKNSYATGEVTGSSTVGGLVGLADSDTTISNSYSAGSVTGTGKDIGGLVGRAYSRTKINNSYWDKNATGRATSASQSSLYGKTTEEMKDKDTYLNENSDWDFETIWKIDEGVSYPTLINNPEKH